MSAAHNTSTRRSTRPEPAPAERPSRRRVELSRSASGVIARRRLTGRMDRNCRSCAPNHRNVPCLSRMLELWAEVPATTGVVSHPSHTASAFRSLDNRSGSKPDRTYKRRAEAVRHTISGRAKGSRLAQRAVKSGRHDHEKRCGAIHRGGPPGRSP